ncbi:MAG TPA: hypothetical protein VFC09_09745 [Candidatus Dormibacteraeota bacterium]|nr:hypothetical protein [Candidatus Dormibacteraeota bacterium]
MSTPEQDERHQGDAPEAPERLLVPQPGDLVWVPSEQAGVCIVEGTTFTGELLIRWPAGDVTRKIKAHQVEAWHRADWTRSADSPFDLNAKPKDALEQLAEAVAKKITQGRGRA